MPIVSVPVRPPLKPGRSVFYLNGVDRSPGTYFVLRRDPFLFGEVGEAYFERWLPRRRVPRRIDILGVVPGSMSARHTMVLARSYDEFGFIALRARRFRAIVPLVRRAKIRVLLGSPGRGPLRWRRVSPSDVGALHALVLNPRGLPVWIRYPRTGRWMFEATERRRQLALTTAAARSSAISGRLVTGAPPPPGVTGRLPTGAPPSPAVTGLPATGGSK